MSINDVADWYNDRYTQEGEYAFGRPPSESIDRLRKIALDQQTGLRVLDIGSGQGYFVAAAQHHGHKTTGIDVAHKGMIIAQDIVPEGNFVTADGQYLPFADASFDVVTYWGTLEHHPNMLIALTECHRVLKTGGMAVMRVPNRDFWLYRIAEILGLSIGTEQQDIIEHLLSYHDWVTLFKKHNFQVDEVQVDDWFVRQNWSETPGFLPKIKMFLRKFSISVAPLRYTYSFDFICHAG